MRPPDNWFATCIHLNPTRDRKIATPLLSNSHQRAEPMNTPATNALAAR